MGSKCSKNKSRKSHIRISILKRLTSRDFNDQDFVTHGIRYWPGKPVRFKHRRKLIKMIEEETVAPNIFETPSVQHEDSKEHLLANESSIGTTEKEPEYPFENLVLSGGGIRGYSYIGAIQALEDAGVLKHIKRFGGTSAGAMCCTILAIGYNAQDIAKCFYLDLTEIFQDQQCVGVACVPKMFTRYGLHPAKRYYDCLGTCLQEKMGNADLTFQELYDRTGREICIATSNISRLQTEYLHYTTTPNLPIRMAVRMSMAVPFIYEPVKCDTSMSGQKKQVYVDGSLGDHFPIRCFDGDKVGLNTDGPINNKTIGCYLVAERDSDYLLWSYIFGKKISIPSYLPNTRIARSQLKEEIKRRKKSQPDFSQKEFMKELQTSCEHLNHYEAPTKTSVETNSIFDVIVTNLESILHNQVMWRLRAEDEARTIPINTGYIKSHDYDLEPADRAFMLNQGYECTMKFIRQYKSQQKPPLSHFRKESIV